MGDIVAEMSNPCHGVFPPHCQGSHLPDPVPGVCDFFKKQAADDIVSALVGIFEVEIKPIVRIVPVNFALVGMCGSWKRPPSARSSGFPPRPGEVLSVKLTIPLPFHALSLNRASLRRLLQMNTG
jgi:hypothetical protein